MRKTGILSAGLLKTSEDYAERGICMVLAYEDKRVIDAEITKKFLADNRNIVKRLIGNFADCMNAEKFRYYLKGGNAIKILDGKDEDHLDGDFDFQLLPGADVYANWAGNFGTLDRELVNILKNTVDSTAAIADIGNFNLDCFEAGTIRNLAITKGIGLGNLQRRERHDDIMYIGRRYGRMPYTGIIEAGGDRRIEEKGIVERAEVQFDDAGAGFGPSVYVNYTIPGFILYRMVYSYRYEMDGQTFNLKSEIIDLSVPRPGSAEVYLSQEGVVTHFRRSGIAAYPFMIPGWGYHFYENINLLQEIALGISGSPDKKQKRIDRLKLALGMLVRANGLEGRLENILKTDINEPLQNGTYRGPYGKIKGYFGALAFSVAEYRGAYHPAAIQGMQIRIDHMIRSYYNNLCDHWGRRYENWERLVYFRIDPKIDLAFHKAEEVRRCVMQYIAGYSWPDGSHPGVRAGMKLEEDYQFISPLPARDEFHFPFDHIVVQIAAKPFGGGSNLYLAFKEYCYRTGNRRFSDCGNAFICVLNEAADAGYKVKRTYGVVFQKYDGVKLPAAATHLKDFLTQSILESQRYPLAKLLENGME